ncbi:MAG: nucleotidyltransferase [Planctomycetes bacterium GWF2_41_51]|nr:MAG: nucleotidyltransferase [Planctomycetes bacterium GWF2_41_51]HBG27005.1 nucleotidyltransferase [Phycisphaerales bacterium]
MRSDRERLLDVIEAIERIEKYSQNSKNAFDTDELVQNWIIHHLFIVGEAAARISDEIQEKYCEVPWSKIIGMRNILVHGYFEIDKDVVWSVVEKDLPELKKNIQKILKETLK